MASEFSIDLSGLEDLAEALSDQEANEAFMDDAAALMLNRIRTRFLAEVDTEGTPWPPSAAALKRRAGGDTGTLFASGRLFHSLQIGNEGPGERSIFTDVPYAAFHQYPIEEVGLRKMPRREFLGISETDMRVIQRAFLTNLKRRLK